jgi:hypothetical protein
VYASPRARKISGDKVWFYPALLSFLNFRGRKPFESAFLFFTKLSGVAATCEIDEVVVLL